MQAMQSSRVQSEGVENESEVLQETGLPARLLLALYAVGYDSIIRLWYKLKYTSKATCMLGNRPRQR